MILCASPQNQAANASQHYTETSKLIVARECGAPPLSVYCHRAAKQPAHLQDGRKQRLNICQACILISNAPGSHGGNTGGELVTVGCGRVPTVLLPYLPAAGRLAHQLHILAVVVRLTQHDLHDWVQLWTRSYCSQHPLS
jgi:hypothetical protein